MARARGLGPRGREFESRVPEITFARVAQLVEQRPEKPLVSGSSPLSGTTPYCIV